MPRKSKIESAPVPEPEMERLHQQAHAKEPEGAQEEEEETQEEIKPEAKPEVKPKRILTEKQLEN